MSFSETWKIKEKHIGRFGSGYINSTYVLDIYEVMWNTEIDIENVTLKVINILIYVYSFV